MAKNPDLCERPDCRAPWTHTVNGYRGQRRWRLTVCAAHAEVYLPAGLDSVGTWVTVARAR